MNAHIRDASRTTASPAYHRLKRVTRAGVLLIAACIAWAGGASCDHAAPEVGGDFFNRFEMLQASAADAESNGADAPRASLEQRTVEAINGATFRVLAAFEDFDSEPIAQALIQAAGRGVDVRVVGDEDRRDQAGFRALEAAGVIPVYGDGPLNYSPSPTVIVDRTGDMNRMSHNAVVIDERRVINLSGGFVEGEDDIFQVGFDVYSEDLAKDFADELVQLHGGVFATTLSGFNGPLKSNTNNRVFYVTQGPVMQVFFGPQERSIKKVIDELYTARASIQIVTEAYSNRFVDDVLEYKSRIGLTTEVVTSLDSVGGDDDGDGIPGDFDNCPRNANPFQFDTDDDGEGDACDATPDGDLVVQSEDNCPGNANQDQEDLDGDGIGDACDGDRDGDFVLNADDNCPNTPNPDQRNINDDRQGDACDADDDGDGIDDDADNCPLVANPEQEDADDDGVGDVCEADSDGDGVTDAVDTCPEIPGADQDDVDGDGLGAPCDDDDDNDGVLDAADNCPIVPNPEQDNLDGDSEGDACDNDVDGDGVVDLRDNCPLTPNADQANSSFDPVGDACDADGDGALDVFDNCPGLANITQSDIDGDNQGDLCDADIDGDNLSNDVDICPLASDPDQENFIGIGKGDACAGPDAFLTDDVYLTIVLIDALPHPVTGERFRTRAMVLSQPLIDTISFSQASNRNSPRLSDGFIDSNMWTLTDYGDGTNAELNRLIDMYDRIKATAEPIDPLQ